MKNYRDSLPFVVYDALMTICVYAILNYSVIVLLYRDGWNEVLTAVIAVSASTFSLYAVKRTLVRLDK